MAKPGPQVLAALMVVVTMGDTFFLLLYSFQQNHPNQPPMIVLPWPVIGWLLVLVVAGVAAGIADIARNGDE